jgi:hypothetical protein
VIVPLLVLDGEVTDTASGVPARAAGMVAWTDPGVVTAVVVGEIQLFILVIDEDEPIAIDPSAFPPLSDGHNVQLQAPIDAVSVFHGEAFGAALVVLEAAIEGRVTTISGATCSAASRVSTLDVEVIPVGSLPNNFDQTLQAPTLSKLSRWASLMVTVCPPAADAVAVDPVADTDTDPLRHHGALRV